LINTTAASDPSRRLLLLTFVLFLSYLCVAISLPVVSIHVTGTLFLGNVWAGLATGATFLATIFSRQYAGRVADSLGASAATNRGLLFYVAGGLISLLSGLIPSEPLLSFAVLLTGRVSIGIGESLVIVGVIAWGIDLAGAEKSGKVMAMVGAAMYGALAAGGPLGLAVLDHFGFVVSMLLGAVLPCLGYVTLKAVPPSMPDTHAARKSFFAVLKTIWAYGAIVALQGVGFAALGAFFALYFRSEGWDYAGLGLTAFGSGFVMVRLTLGHLPDRIGGLPVAIGSLAVETLGLALIWLSGDPVAALIGAFITGLGCSMVYPSIGREVVVNVQPHVRGTALSAFAAFQDLSYGLTGPLAGILADRAGYPAVFGAGAVAAAVGFFTAFALNCRQRSGTR